MASIKCPNGKDSVLILPDTYQDTKRIQLLRKKKKPALKKENI